MGAHTGITLHILVFLGPPLGLGQFSTTESPLKMMKNAFYFMLKALFVFKIFTFFSWLLGHAGKRLGRKAKVSFRIYDNTHNAQYLKN